MTNEEENINIMNTVWLNKYWRPLAAVVYLAICVFDFIIFPILWTFAFIYTEADLVAWDPLTLKAAGTFHLAFGAILGVAAWSRGKEKMAGVADEYTYPERRGSSEARPQYDPPRRRQGE